MYSREEDVASGQPDLTVVEGGPSQRAERIAAGSATALFLVQAGWILAAMDYNLYNFALPMILTDLNISLPTAGLIFFLSLQGTFVGSLVVPIIADYVGRRKAMMGNILLYAFATAAVAFAPVAWFLILARFLVNFGVGGEQPVGAAYVSETWNPKTRGRAMGFMQSGWAIGSLLASVVLIVVGATWGWRPMFLLGIVPAALVVAIRVWLPESQKWIENRRARETATDGSDKFTLAQLFDPDLRRFTIIGTLLLIVGNSGSGGIMAWAPTFLATERGLDIAAVGWFGTMLSIGMLVGYNAFGFIADAIGRRPTLALYFFLSILSIGVFALVRDMVFLGFATFWVGLTTAGAFAGFIIYLSELFPTRARATGVGWCMGIGLFFWALVPFIMGVMAPGSDLGTVFVTIAPAVYVVGLIVLAFAPETKGKELV